MNGLQLAGLFQVHEGAIDLVGAHGAIFKDQEGTGGVEFPRRADGGLKKGEATAEKPAFRDSFDEGFAEERKFPARDCVTNGLKQGILVVAVGIVGAAIEACGDHRTVEGDPAAHLPQIGLQRSEIAEADDAFGFEQLRGEIVVQEIG